MLIDTHAHLYSDQFDHDRAEMIERAVVAGVERFYLPNIDSTSIVAMLKMEEKWPDRCFPMMGLHPCSVKDNYQEELSLVREWLLRRPFVAVGEIGIDLYWDKSFQKEQEVAFSIQIEWAKEFNIPIVIHSRESIDLCIDHVQSQIDNKLNGIFHCFSGNIEQAKRIVDLGFYLGIGGVSTFKNSGLDKFLNKIPLKHILLETDSPYLAPKPYRGKRNESAYISIIASRLSEIYKLPKDDIARITSENALVLFGKN